MKKLSLIAAALVLASSGAFAATATDTFDVTVNFTSSCSVKTATTDLSFTYTAFQGTDATAGGSTVFECSRGLTPTFNFDNPGGNQTGSAASGTTFTGAGVVKGLRYTLDGSASKTQTGDAATAALDGTSDEYTVTIGGTIAQGQAGDNAGGATQTRTLTITY